MTFNGATQISKEPEIQGPVTPVNSGALFERAETTGSSLPRLEERAPDSAIVPEAALSLAGAVRTRYASRRRRRSSLGSFATAALTLLISLGSTIACIAFFMHREARQTEAYNRAIDSANATTDQQTEETKKLQQSFNELQANLESVTKDLYVTRGELERVTNENTRLRDNRRGILTEPVSPENPQKEVAEQSAQPSTAGWAVQREWARKSDNRKRLGRLHGLSKDGLTAFIEMEGSEGQPVPALLSDLNEADRIFCKEMLDKYRDQILIRPAIDLSEYDGSGFQKLQHGLEKYCNKVMTLPSSYTSFQMAEQIDAARKKAVEDLSGIELKIPVLVDDVVSLENKGIGSKLRLDCKCLYQHFPLPRSLTAWFPQADARMFRRGTVVWVSGLVHKLKQPRALERHELWFNPDAFMAKRPNIQVTIPKEAAEIKIPFYVTSLNPTTEAESITLLNRFGH